MPVHRNAALAPLTTLQLGGAARSLVVLGDRADFADVVHHVTTVGAAPAILGAGSNVIVADEGVASPVLHIKTRGISAEIDGGSPRVLLTVEAGHSWQELVDYTLAYELRGMEAMTGIPGTVGATPVQNVGAYGQEVSDSVVEVVAWDWQRSRLSRLMPNDCHFSHRSSVFKRSARYTILLVKFALIPSPMSGPLHYKELTQALDLPQGSTAPLSEVAKAVTGLRRGKGMILDPTDVDGRSAGSVFLSPRIDAVRVPDLIRRGASVHSHPDGTTRVSSSFLIREAGYKLGEWVRPGVRLSTKHWTLVAEDGATSACFIDAVADMQRRVEDSTGVTLVPELDLLGRSARYEAMTGTVRTALTGSGGADWAPGDRHAGVTHGHCGWPGGSG
jgi:UDP-N-acetylmuramate dehydrogenase